MRDLPDWDDVSEEISQHLDDRYRELRAGGASHEDARRAALAEIDDADFMSAVSQIQRRSAVATDIAPLGGSGRSGFLHDIAHDVRYGWRTIRQNPLFSSIVVLTLALGIGANAAIFSVVNAIVLRPLPYHDASRLVVLWDNLGRHGLSDIEVSALEYTEFRDRNRVFAQTAAYTARGFNVSGAAATERLDGADTTATLFPVLGVRPALGRLFEPSDERPGRDVIVLGHGAWQRLFGGDAGILGRLISIDNRPAEVIGVMPPGFHFPDETTEIWKPIAFDADLLSENNRGSRAYAVVARLAPGVTAAQARAGMNAVTDQMGREHPDAYRGGYFVTVRPLQQEIVGNTSRALLLQLGAVGLVLLIACANVANLLLARAAARRREVAIRMALGARRSRIVRQLLTESLLLACSGGAIGLLAAVWGVDLLVAMAPADIPRLSEISLDGRVVAFTAAVSIATGVLFGLAPAIHASRAAPGDQLKQGGRPAASGRRATGQALIVSEVALALVLLVAAALLVSSFARLQRVEPGFAVDHLLTLRIAPAEAKYTTFEQGEAFYDTLLARLRALPAVRSAGAVNGLPLTGFGGDRSLYLEDRDNTRPENAADEQIRFATPGYFDAMRIPMLRGRGFTDRDVGTAPRVAVVNDAFARKFWPSGDALGKRLTFSLQQPAWYQIVGVAGNVKHRALDAPDRPEVYVPYAQPLFAGSTVRPMFVAVRTDTDPLAASAMVREAVAALDRDQPVSNVRSMEQRLDESLSARRFTTVLLALFSSVALLLAAIGIYGIVSYSVTERVQEIGVRLALGARRLDVLALIVRQGMTLACGGALLGVGAAVAATRLLSTLLYEVSPSDPATFAAAIALVAGVAFVACWAPARRASRVDPLVAIRTE